MKIKSNKKINTKVNLKIKTLITYSAFYMLFVITVQPKMFSQEVKADDIYSLGSMGFTIDDGNNFNDKEFLWYRDSGNDPSKVIMSLNQSGNLGLGIYPAKYRLNVFNPNRLDRQLTVGNTRDNGTFMYFGTSASSNGYSHIQSIKAENWEWGNLVLNPVKGNVGVGINPDAVTNAKLHVGGKFTVENEGIKISMFISKNKNAWIGSASNHGLFLGTNNNVLGTNMYLDTNNNVFVGGVTNNDVSTILLTQNDLFVQNGILAEDLTIGAKQFWADYVFEKEYRLKPLSEVEQFIKKNKHLPNIPSKKVISEEGYSIHEINVKLLEKIEELTLYVIQLEKDVKLLNTKLNIDEVKSR